MSLLTINWITGFRCTLVTCSCARYLLQDSTADELATGIKNVRFDYDSSKKVV